jgi:hypothetical protein
VCLRQLTVVNSENLVDDFEAQHEGALGPAVEPLHMLSRASGSGREKVKEPDKFIAGSNPSTLTYWLDLGAVCLRFVCVTDLGLR